MSKHYIGEIGAQFLLEALSVSTQPFKTIEEFREANGLKQSQDMSEVHSNLVTKLRTEIVKRISNNLDSARLETLLEQSFPFISFDELKIIPMTILTHMKAVPVKFLKQLSANKELYDSCPIEVKRQIWEAQDEIFKEEIYTILYDYITSNDFYYAGYEMAIETSVPPTKRRQDDARLQKLITYIGTSLKLYNLVLHYFRELYVNTRNPIFCSLRADILMGFHDAGVSQIYEFDPCHTLAWCLDACVRDNSIGPKRLQEMQLFFDYVLETDSIWPDLAMIVSSPFTQNMLLRNIITLLQKIPGSKTKPKFDETIVYVTELLSLGFHCEEMLKTQLFGYPKIEKGVLNKFYSILASKMVDDGFATGVVPGPTIEAETAQSKFESFVQKNPIAKQVRTYDVVLFIRKVIFSYLVRRAQKNDTKNLAAYLALLEQTDFESERSFVQSIISELIANTKSVHLRTAVIDNFLLAKKDSSVYVHKQLVRFLMEAALRIPLNVSVQYLHKLLDNFTEETRRIFTATYEQLLTRTGHKFTETNARILFEFLQKTTTTPTTPKESASPSTYSPASFKEDRSSPITPMSPEYAAPDSSMEVEQQEEQHNGHSDGSNNNTINKDD